MERFVERGWFERAVGDPRVGESHPVFMLNSHGLYVRVWGRQSRLPVSRAGEMVSRPTMPRASAGVLEYLSTRTLRPIMTGTEWP